MDLEVGGASGRYPVLVSLVVPRSVQPGAAMQDPLCNASTLFLLLYL